MTITIAEQPVLVDFNGEAQAWLDRFMPESNLFFDPIGESADLLSGQAESNSTSECFRSALPSLPPIKIGQIQWPCVGVSRYARGLFLVDSVAKDAINLGNSVPIALTADFTIYMFALLPIRVSDDLWILRLVDQRYYKLSEYAPGNAINQLMPSTTWPAYFSSLAGSYAVAYTHESSNLYGNPDMCFRDSIATGPFVVDAACFSVGCRPVVPINPVAVTVGSELIVKCERPTTALTKRTTLLAMQKITGGICGRGSRPTSIRASARLVEKKYSGNNRRFIVNQSIPTNTSGLPVTSGGSLFTKCVWNYNGSGGYLAAYLNAIAEKVSLWNHEEYYVVIPDLVKLDPSGFDDYIIYECSGDKKTTTVRSLPVDFFPLYLLAQEVATGADSDAALWFHTSKPSATGRLVNSIGACSTTIGLRNRVTIANVQLHDFSLYLAGTPPTFIAVRVIAINATRDAGAVGKVVHLCWVNDVVAAYGGGGDVGIPYEGWVITSIE